MYSYTHWWNDYSKVIITSQTYGSSCWTIRIKKNDTDLYLNNTTYFDWNNADDISLETSISTWDVIKFYYWVNNTQNINARTSWDGTVEIIVSKPTDYKEIKIYNVVWLWNDVSAYTLGRLPDNSRWDWGLWGWAWWLPIEFVEKITKHITPQASWNFYATESLWTYDYDTFMIAKRSSWNVAVLVSLWQKYNNSVYPNTYWQSTNMTSNFLKWWVESYIFVLDSSQSWWCDYDIYVYKLNLPS